MEQTASELQNLGRWLSLARVRAGLTQQQFAARCGTDQSTISRIEMGQRSPSVGQLLQFARVLAVPLQWFLSGRERPGADLSQLAIELHALGVVDLLVEGAAVPGAFRPAEEVVALAVGGDRPDPRIVEAVPAVLAWNPWYVPLLQAYSTLYDRRAQQRLAWLADVALTLDRGGGFPGGCPEKRKLELFIEWAGAPSEEDSLGHPATDGLLPPVWKRWKITYAATLSAFRERAEHLWRLGEPRRLPAARPHVAQGP
jgi:transcriptional regulator with XRE-family HTH domain